jgi:hypothetical protein
MNLLKFFQVGFEGKRPSTPSIRHNGSIPKSVAKAPNDGRWHMKFHRNRHR